VDKTVPAPTEVSRLERQLAVTQQLTHIGSWDWNVTAGSVTWSDELYRVYGLVPRSVDITVEFFLSRVHPGDRDAVQAKVAQVLERGGSFQWLERIVRPDGSVRLLDTVGEALVDDERRVTALVGTCRDVTEENRRQEQLRLYEDIVHNVQIGLSVWSPRDRGDDPSSLRLAAFNPASEHIVRMPLAPCLGKRFEDIVPYAAGGEVDSLLQRVARDRKAGEATVERSRDRRETTRALSVKGFPLPGNSVGLAIEDVTAQTVERRLRVAEHDVLEMIAGGGPIRDSLSALVLAVQDRLPGTIGSVLLLAPDGQHVHHAAAPSLPQEYTRAIDGAAIGPRAGSCGAALFLKRPVFVVDVETDAFWEDYRELALRHGLRACWSTPILASDRRVLGSFAFYYRSPRKPTDEDVEIVERVSRLAGIAIERKQLEEQLHDFSAHMETALEEERKRIAREIHDELGQGLTALKMDLAWIMRRASAETLTCSEMLEKLAAMSAFTDEIIGQVRRISADLRPGILDDLGLVAAVEWQAQDFEQRTGTPCDVVSTSTGLEVDPQTTTAVFRIFKEALTNVSRHAEAQRVCVRIDVSADAVSLEVSDDGKGIDPGAMHNPKSLGLLGIRERAGRLGGSVCIGPCKPRGTRVTAQIPLVKPSTEP